MTGPTEPPPDTLPATGAATALRVVRRQEEPDRMELVLHGELDITTFPIAQREISSVQDQRPAILVLDMAELAYLDSSGIRLVLLAQQHADDSGRKVAVRLGDGQARRLFDMLGLADRFDVLDAGPAIDADTDTARRPDGTADDRGQGSSP
ncbi:MAG TPA: STAS domain-containing protein [Actinomycetospora sp.]|jgi:anti-anti-sigma factor|uniref:STAS domain-containing protein n=1 Tax=Actinomycetospora sp. TaxID=1872135 RepID=UPI002F420AE3